MTIRLAGQTPTHRFARSKIDRQLTFDKLTNVHYSGTRHPEDQPSHLIVHDAEVCRTRCRTEYGNPCTRFCPANVYEMVDAGDGTKKLQINASNCVHCKTCDIMDPYQLIDWVPPEGSGRTAVRGHVTRGKGTRDKGKGKRQKRLRPPPAVKSACGPSEGPEGSAAKRRPRARASGGARLRQCYGGSRRSSLRERRRRAPRAVRNADKGQGTRDKADAPSARGYC